MTVAPEAPAPLRSARIHEMLTQAAELHRRDAISQAAEIYEIVLKEAPDDPDALHLAGLIAYQRGYMPQALELTSRSLAIRPHYGAAHGTLGLALGATGRHLSAMAEFRRAVALDPSLTDVWANRIFAADHDPGTTKEMARSIRREFDALHIRPHVEAAPPCTNDRDTDRPLVVGYVTNDARLHSAAMMFLPVVSRHDTERFRVVIFDGTRKHDAVSERLFALPITRHDIRGKTDDDVAALVRSERVDVLVDLTGFAGGSRLGVFARRPAPVQVQGWSYLADTLALSCFDGIFCDAITLPPGDEDGFTERPLRMPAFIPYEPLVEMPEVGPPPAERNGYVTFGYLGRATLLNDEVLQVWAEILRRVPISRLLLKTGQLEDEDYRFTIIDALVARGVSDHRIEVRGNTNVAEHAATYAEVDIALDTWPQNGAITTLEAAYQGVPTVSLAGDRMGARKGASILTILQQRYRIAKTVDDYVRIAVDLSKVVSLDCVRSWRAGLRTDIRDGFMQHDAYTRAVEEAYVDLFLRWAREGQ